MLRLLAPVRDKILDDADVGPGVTVLDVGCGDGLVGLGALERAADVIFSDISEASLADCRAIPADPARYHVAPATDLGAIEADVVTTRSVLIYVDDKQRAFDEFFRVLRPGGRLSIFEPINRFGMEERSCDYGFDDVAGVEELLARIWKNDDDAGVNDAMVNFDERDLFAHGLRAGFRDVRMELRAEVRPAAMWQMRDWNVFVNSSPNPLLPTFAEAMDSALAPDEVARLTEKLRPQVEAGRGTTRLARCWLVARKDEG